ncbi:MAG TPA: hypothetical protein VLX29_00895 [Nitrospirota bacterium]|nr:hypothetical protein [Nitrospirota bacterium]
MDSLSILMGWLLGMLSPAIVNNIQKKYTKKALHKGICTEFDELRYILIFNCYILGKISGNYDRNFLQWFIQNAEVYSGDEGIIDITLPAVKKLLEFNDAALAAYVTSERERRSSNILSLKKINATFTDLNLSELSIFNVDYQSLLLGLKRLIDNINDETTKVENLCNMTFDSSVSRDNYEIISKNINDKYSQIQSMSITLVNKITEFLNVKQY